jgi:hypothetical protein
MASSLPSVETHISLIARSTSERILAAAILPTFKGRDGRRKAARKRGRQTGKERKRKRA